jgi:nucleotide-binding universal stress UspA family protein
MALVRVTWAAKEAKALASRAAERIRSSFPDWWVRAEEYGGAPPRELMRTAGEWEADLLVVGSPRRSLLGRLFLGSVSRTVVADALCSVRVSRSRTGRDDDAPPRILIGVDGSPEAEGAVRAVGRRVWPTGTKVRVVAVDDSVSPRRFRQILPAAAAMITRRNNEVAARARDMVEWATGELRLIGLDTSVAFGKGDARRVLLEEARAWCADCVFVGSRSFGGALERFRTGRVSTAVAMDAPCSVEVVRAL